ncbi:MAG: Cell division protein ftsB [Pseudomonadota bacterium]|jgi:cell division protein FtsB
MFKLILAILMIGLTLMLQNRLWNGEGGIGQILEYENRLKKLKQEVQESQDRNAGLYAEVLNLRNGTEAIEERARHELGMIKSTETFFQIIESP